ncbi:MAG: type I restriction enzyme HsdR N-terminal domain-containing protein [Bacteroidia bacterium]|nr:type I restriction enzyme HsdR N-terminal domain-containing protein [Bacteroidia bacterium]
MKLNFRTYNFNTKVEQGNALIFDIIRKKYVRLTPEEWVRQHLLHYLIEDLNVPKGLIAVERSLVFNGLTKRFDICVSNRNGEMTLLIECKAPQVKLSQQTLMQAGTYQKVLNVQLIAISNGINHIFMRLVKDAKAPELLSELPPFEEWS